MKFEGLDKSDAITEKGSEYYNNPEKFALDKLNYYECFKCKVCY